MGNGLIGTTLRRLRRHAGAPVKGPLEHTIPEHAPAAEGGVLLIDDYTGRVAIKH
jgi:hypothetical protein